MKRRLYKKKNNKLFYLISILFIIPLIFILNFKFNNQNKFLIIGHYSDNFYIIPKDKKGLKIPNTDKRILDLDLKKQEKNLTNQDKFRYSIQLYSSQSYEKTYNKYLAISENNSLKIEDLSIVAFNHNLGLDYLIIYKNFNNQKDGLNYCKNNLKYTENCLVININNL